jgi:hypothetical protein
MLEEHAALSRESAFDVVSGRSVKPYTILEPASNYKLLGSLQ